MGWIFEVCINFQPSSGFDYCCHIGYNSNIYIKKNFYRLCYIFSLHHALYEGSMLISQTSNFVKVNSFHQFSSVSVHCPLQYYFVKPWQTSASCS